MNELGKEAKQRGGVTNEDADTLLEWGKKVDPNNEKGLRGRDDRGETHWKGGRIYTNKRGVIMCNRI